MSWACAGLKASIKDIRGQTWVDPEHYVNDTVIPVHRFFLGLTDFSTNATRREIASPRGVVAQVIKERRWLGQRTWVELQRQMNEQRVLGLLWNHYNEAHQGTWIHKTQGNTDAGGKRYMDWGPHIEGVFHSEEYLRYAPLPRARVKHSRCATHPHLTRAQG